MQINLMEYLIEAAKKSPDKTAFVDEFESISFLELYKRTKSAGSFISDAINHKRNIPVIVMADRNVSTLVSFLAVLYSGNIYVPVDINTPGERFTHIISVVEPWAVICCREYKEQNEFISKYEAGTKILNILVYEDLIINNKPAEFENRGIDTDSAYIMFTSGSTGIPKGVVIPHRAVIDLAEWLTETFGFKGTEIIGNQTPFFFDASVKDIYLTLKNACTMHILPKKLFSSPLLLIKYLNENKIDTILWATSAVKILSSLNAFKSEKPQYLKKIFFAGENMPAKQLNYWRTNIPDAEYINLYGPTEITVDCTYFKVNRNFPDDEDIPIGFPCKNKEILLLDDEMSEVCENTTGEIYVRGTGVSFGYYNNPEQSEKYFIQNPQNKSYREYIYKTGDHAKRNEYGELVFISRADAQIKHMGNRIELGEIEKAVNSTENIENAVCIYDKEKSKIILFCSGDNVCEKYIFEALSTKLPKYMFPNKICILDNFPYTPNGKLDRVKLEKGYHNGEY